mmetsp:Transcript_6797/g.10691  ORF Transcript_6797/g.10691 Transcript_6797/m.10691 type:complete len:657 (+) Transcript_6797:457-2427(+)
MTRLDELGDPAARDQTVTKTRRSLLKLKDKKKTGGQLSTGIRRSGRRSATPQGDDSTTPLSQNSGHTSGRSQRKRKKSFRLRELEEEEELGQLGGKDIDSPAPAKKKTLRRSSSSLAPPPPPPPPPPIDVSKPPLKRKRKLKSSASSTTSSVATARSKKKLLKKKALGPKKFRKSEMLSDSEENETLAMDALALFEEAGSEPEDDVSSADPLEYESGSESELVSALTMLLSSQGLSPKQPNKTKKKSPKVSATAQKEKEAKNKKRESILYRFSRRDLAIALFSHIAIGKGDCHQMAIFSNIIMTIFKSEKWNEPELGAESKIDICSLSKDTLIKCCIELEVKLSHGRRPAFSASASQATTTRYFKKQGSFQKLESQKKSQRVSGRGEGETRDLDTESKGTNDQTNDDGATDEEGELVCICGYEFTHDRMVQCSGGPDARCHGWVHPECVGLDVDEKNLQELDEYLCPLCAHEKKGQTIDLMGEEDRRKRKTCFFCADVIESKCNKHNRTQVDQEMRGVLGEYIGPFVGQNSSREYWCHRLCAVSGAGVGVTPDGLWYNVVKSLQKFEKTRCIFCQRKGANVCYQKGKKTRNAHLPCLFDYMTGKDSVSLLVTGAKNHLAMLPHFKSKDTSTKEFLDDARLDKQIEIIMELKGKLNP